MWVFMLMLTAQIMTFLAAIGSFFTRQRLLLFLAMIGSASVVGLMNFVMFDLSRIYSTVGEIFLGYFRPYVSLILFTSGFALSMVTRQVGKQKI